MILLSIILFLTILEAVHEGLALRGRISGNPRLGTIAGLIEMGKHTGTVAIVMLLIYTPEYDYYLSSPVHFFVWFMIPLVIGWLALRYGLFDWIHNLCAGLDWKYIGKTKLYDKFLRRITKRQPPFAWHFWTRLVLLLLGLGLIIKL